MNTCRIFLVAAVALLLAAPAAAATRPTRSTVRATSAELGVVAAINQVRVAHGLVPVRLSAPLSAAAAAHNREMLAGGYFAHESAGGGAFWKRVARFYGNSLYAYWSTGENLVWSSGDLDAGRALQLWMASPQHRENILTPRWREIGISLAHVDVAPGVYAGSDVTLITTDFGVRR